MKDFKFAALIATMPPERQIAFKERMIKEIIHGEPSEELIRYAEADSVCKKAVNDAFKTKLNAVFNAGRLYRKNVQLREQGIKPTY